MSLRSISERKPLALAQYVGSVVGVTYTSRKGVPVEIVGRLVGASIEPTPADASRQGHLRLYLTASGGVYAARVVEVPADSQLWALDVG